MSIQRIKQTRLWKSTLAERQNDEHSDKREELRAALIKFRENAATLVGRISSALPGLTQHDVTHLDALWEKADLIIGEKFDLTPLEAFVLGGSILLHDSALCFEAYEDGLSGIRKTVEWKDSYTSLSEKEFESEEELMHQADFFTLRQLHAFQAEKLLDFNWIDPDTKQSIFLLENQNLRKHLGNLIGLIASSHHWDIETLTTKLPSQQNALASYPRDWRIDPIKVACILRCADATHIDNERAPDFFYALLKRHGVSFNHWKAQNRLSVVDFDQSEKEKKSLIFNSTIDFSESETDAWYVVYDAICLVDKELKSCNSLLESRGCNPFQATRVLGVESPESLSRYIKAEGWKPCSAEVHVGNIEKIIQNLGGEMLYGASSDLLGIVIRELIQNARDSIHARKFVDNGHTGKIKITLQKVGEENWLSAEDDGIGMSERVLTGPLLDFGTSFWTSSLVQSEFPGLRSSNFKSIGKFGIGFYSVFMIAKKVFVTTKSWTEGLTDLKELKFNKGFSLRPILTKGEIADFGSTNSTKIKVLLKDGLVEDNRMIEIKTNRSGSVNFHVPIAQYISAIVAGLDTSVDYQEDGKSIQTIHKSIDSQDFDRVLWLKNISFSSHQKNVNTETYINRNANRLKPIINNSKIHGLAAINTQLSNHQTFLSSSTVGGLSHNVHARDGEKFIGYIDYNPNSAKREIGKYSAGDESIKQWAQEQLNELLSLSLNPVEKYCASSALCHFKTDPSSLCQILVIAGQEQKFVSFQELAELSTESGIAFLESGHGGHMETYHNVSQFPNYILVRPLMNSSFISLKISDDIPENNNSILDCLYRKSIEMGYQPAINKIINVAKNTFGMHMNAIILKSKKN